MWRWRDGGYLGPRAHGTRQAALKQQAGRSNGGGEAAVGQSEHNSSPCPESLRMFHERDTTAASATIPSPPQQASRTMLPIVIAGYEFRALIDSSEPFVTAALSIIPGITVPPTHYTDLQTSSHIWREQ